VYLLKGGSKLILVDTGVGDPDWANRYHNPCPRDKSQEPITALSRLGVTPEEIDIVILTHLHWDHCFNNSIFPKARFIVQKDEIQYALFPLPIHALYYEAFSVGMTPPWLKNIGRFEILDGNRENIRSSLMNTVVRQGNKHSNFLAKDIGRHRFTSRK